MHDVLESFVSRTIHDIAAMARLCGAASVIVRIQLDVALATVSLGTDSGSITTALDRTAQLRGGCSR